MKYNQINWTEEVTYDPEYAKQIINSYSVENELKMKNKVIEVKDDKTIKSITIFSVLMIIFSVVSFVVCHM